MLKKLLHKYIESEDTKERKKLRDKIFKELIKQGKHDK